MKLKVVYRKVSDYIRYDLKEIVLPSSLPDPPHVVKRRKLTWHERYLVLKEASRLYAASWVRDIGPELRPNDYKKQGDAAEPKKQAKETEKEPSVLEDLAVAARGGMETLRPALHLHRVYMTRASNYKDALASFIKGCHEGVQQVMQSKEESQLKSLKIMKRTTLKRLPDLCLLAPKIGFIRFNASMYFVTPLLYF